MGVYQEFSHINALPIKDRVVAFKNTALELIQKGHSAELLKEVAQDLIDDEMYEAAQGVLQALECIKEQ